MNVVECGVFIYLLTMYTFMQLPKEMSENANKK